jgi:hypothetical protein
MARDYFHYTVVNAMQKDGWNITDDPLNIKYGEVDLKVDLGVEKIIIAQKGTKKIAVEIKSFIKTSIVSEFNSALGQYLAYYKIISKTEPDRELYLAIPSEVYNFIFKKPFFIEMIDDYNLKLIVYEPSNEEIVKWIN